MAFSEKTIVGEIALDILEENPRAQFNIWTKHLKEL
jgi:hypothetical protein